MRSTSDTLTALDIVRRTTDVADMPDDDAKFADWRAAIRDADAALLIEATARLSSDPGKRTRDLKALREAIISEVERKNAQAVVDTMEKLDKSAARLTWVSLALTIVGVLLAAIQVLHDFG